MVKHVCATMESGDFDDIRLNKRGKWDQGIQVGEIWVLAEWPLYSNASTKKCVNYPVPPIFSVKILT